uniref:Uncharacterized protein n=1 Tax=Anguilla anguilla TaxID=7936 RepID=A0A0E9TX10_ANGAN
MLWLARTEDKLILQDPKRNSPTRA